MSWRTLIAVAAVVGLADSAKAQPPAQLGVPQRPAFSPYLNLVRPGGSPALNYYGLVRPEIQARQAIQNLQGVVATNQQAIGSLQAESGELSTTGHQALFMNHGSYFMTGGAAGFGGAGVGARPGAGPPVSGGFNRTPPRR